MDSLRGNFSDGTDYDADFDADYDIIDSSEDEIGREPPPFSVGQDERRMQVRAYNHWASLLEDRRFPSIEDLEPETLTDFGPYSVLLDFTGGVEDPGIAYLGDLLAAQCGTDDEITQLSDVPSRSLLSRITDHYMQILANEAPIGFEAEFVNQQDRTILYRGILLPYSTDDDTIDFIYGVINWKELADQRTTDELLLEIDQALTEIAPDASPEAEPEPEAELAPLPESPSILQAKPVREWPGNPLADAALTGQDDEDEDEDDESCAEDDDDDSSEGSLLDLGSLMRRPAPAVHVLPQPDFGGFEPLPEPAAWQAADGFGDDAYDMGAAMGALDESAMELGDWLASARELAEAAHASEDRTRGTLYAALGRAYDFSLAAAAAPDDFAELVADSGLTMQDRAPMTPVVKLVFGARYDKTRLAEYGTALQHGQRLGLGRGELADYLAQAEGGLKGVVTAERRLRREEAGKMPVPVTGLPDRLAAQLRTLDDCGLEGLAPEGEEFALVLVRREPAGGMAVLGEVPHDRAMLERAARKLAG